MQNDPRELLVQKLLITPVRKCNTMIRTEKLQEGYVFILEDKNFDYSNAAQFMKHTAALSYAEIHAVSVDLLAVHHIDSSAISKLLKLQEELPEPIRPITLKNVRPEILCVIELMRLHRVFAIEPLSIFT